VGKTTLVVALAYDKELLEHFENGVLWASLGKGGDPLTHLNTWGQALGTDVTAFTDRHERASAVKQIIGDKKILIVIDDAWEYDTTDILRVGGPYCVHLLTTRDQAIAAQFSEAGNRHIDTLDDEQAMALFQKLVPEIENAYQEDAKNIIAATAGLPLSLKLICSYLNVPRLKLRKSLSKKALEELADPEHRLALVGKRLGGGITQSLEEAVQLSLKALSDLEGG
jgi:hypothetical protein